MRVSVGGSGAHRRRASSVSHGDGPFAAGLGTGGSGGGGLVGGAAAAAAEAAAAEARAAEARKAAEKVAELEEAFRRQV